MASGQPSGSTRMLHTTIAIASTKATTSTQVTGAPHSVKAGANSGCIHCSRSVMGSAFRGRHLDVDLVRLDHAELEARLLLDHLQAFLQVADLGDQALVARACRVVLVLLL